MLTVHFNSFIIQIKPGPRFHYGCNNQAAPVVPNIVRVALQHRLVIRTGCSSREQATHEDANEARANAEASAGLAWGCLNASAKASFGSTAKTSIGTVTSFNIDEERTEELVITIDASKPNYAYQVG